MFRPKTISGAFPQLFFCLPYLSAPVGNTFPYIRRKLDYFYCFLERRPHQMMISIFLKTKMSRFSFSFLVKKKKGLHKRSKPSDLDESDQTLDNVITMIEAMVYQLQRVQGTSKGAPSAL